MEQAAADHVSASRQPGLVLQQSLRPWDSDWLCVRMWVMSDGGAVCAAVWWLLTGCVCVCGERHVVYMWWLDMIVCLCDEWCVVCCVLCVRVVIGFTFLFQTIFFKILCSPIGILDTIGLDKFLVEGFICIPNQNFFRSDQVICHPHKIWAFYHKQLACFSLLL